MAVSLIVDPTSIRDIAPDVLDDDQRLRILPASYWATTTTTERALFGHRQGLYSFPTVELVDHVRALIGGRSAIEIGAGHGALAQALDIPATDSHQQNKSPYRELYEKTGQPTVRYGPHVVDLDAAAAVRHHKPQVVIGCWVTHRYDPERHFAGGNEAGVDEEDILDHCETYVVVGNDTVHKWKAIWGRPHHIEHPRFLYSRARDVTADFIATWAGTGP